MSSERRPEVKRRASQIDPPNRFGGSHHELDLSELEVDDDYFDKISKRETEYIPDHTQSIVAENNSPDVGFRFSINPYRGCSHGCSYCYARPTHEFLAMNAGLDFETKIMVKEQAPKLFREFLMRDGWHAEMIAFSGVTDCYQPAERQYQLTRQCLEVASEANQPISIITKNALVTRDIDLLAPMAAKMQAHVFLSITTLDLELCRTMEPRTSTPSQKLIAVRRLTEAGIPVGVMVAPVIPGLNDTEIPAILKAAKEAGAKYAGYIMLRLPLTVAPVFQEWLERTQPNKSERVLGRLKEAREGKLNTSEFGKRMRGTGVMADQISAFFKLWVRKLEFDRSLPTLNSADFRPPLPISGQLRLF